MANLTQSAIGQEYLQTYPLTIFTRGDWYRYENGVWNKTPEPDIRREIWQIAEKWEKRRKCRPTANLVGGILKYVLDHRSVREEMIDAYPNLINLLNGTFDIEWFTLLTHHPDRYLTTQLPFAYDPAAQCPTWEYFLQTTLTKPAPNNREHDLELATFLQEAIGYSLSPSIEFHCSFWIWGRGANGKSVLLHVLESLAGTSFCPLNMDLLKHDRYQLANLAGKRVAICSEANSRDNVVEDATIKALISGDTMVVRQIREQPFNLQPQAKLWWAMNKLPAVADTSDGFWRRIFLIPFNRTFTDSERIPDLVDQLINELPGIFNWAMEGLKRLRANGGFTVPAQVERQTAEYRKDSNIVETFIEEECVVDQNDQVQSSVIYQAYRDWCKSNGYQAYSSRNFKRELNELGYPAKRYATAVFFLGINLRVSP